MARNHDGVGAGGRSRLTSSMAASALFCSLGTAQAMVIEALLLGKGKPYKSCHIISTSAPEVKTEQIEHFCKIEGIECTIYRVPNVQNMEVQEEHDRFLSALYNWYIDFPIPFLQRDVCLAGGYKTIVAGVQKTAQVFGCRSLFHVLAEKELFEGESDKRMPNTVDEIRAGIKKGTVRKIEVGPENGNSLALSSVEQIKNASNARNAVDEILQKSATVVSNWQSFDRLPFSCLVGFSKKVLNWLHEPLDPRKDAGFIKALPKVELHCHLGGFATHGVLLKMVQGKAEEIKIKEQAYPPHWPQPLDPTPLDEYMRLGDANGSTLLHDPKCLDTQLELLYEHFKDENIKYGEIRCSPYNYAKNGRTSVDVVTQIVQKLEQLATHDAARGKTPTYINVIIIATRKNRGDLSAISKHLALAVTASNHYQGNKWCRVVGVDLAGYENKETRPQYFQTDFQVAHRSGLAVTVHAGENDEAEAVWQAVFHLNAQRLGHALNLTDAPDLMRAVASKGIGVEMCPYANYQIVGFKPMKPPARRRTDTTERNAKSEMPEYPLLNYLEQGIKVTVNTDNIGISNASLSENYLFLATLLPQVTRWNVLQLIRNGIDVAFLSPVQKEGLLKEFEQLVYHVVERYSTERVGP